MYQLYSLKIDPNIKDYCCVSQIKLDKSLAEKMKLRSTRTIHLVRTVYLF